MGIVWVLSGIACRACRVCTGLCGRTLGASLWVHAEYMFLGFWGLFRCGIGGFFWISRVSEYVLTLRGRGMSRQRAIAAHCIG